MLPPSAWSIVGRPEPVRHTKDHRHRHIEKPVAPREEAPAVTIRRARDEDAALLSALAALDSALPLEGDVLVAQIAGAPVAAVELATGRAIADPFARSSETVGLLRLRAEQLRAAGSSERRFRRIPVPRIAGLL